MIFFNKSKFVGRCFFASKIIIDFNEFGLLAYVIVGDRIGGDIEDAVGGLYVMHVYFSMHIFRD